MAFILGNSLTALGFLVLSLETMIGIFFSMFAIGILINGLKRKKTMKAGNKIRIALSISNVCYSASMFAGVSSGVLLPGNVQLDSPVSVYIVYSLTMFTVGGSTWLTATLTLFYFMKIVDLKVRAMVWAKKNINDVVSWMILGVEMVALLSSVFGMLYIINPCESSLNNSMTSLYNSTSSFATDLVRFFLIVDCVPFLTIVATATYTARTLMKHSRYMIKNMGASVNSNAKSLRYTMFIMLRIITCFTLYYLSMLLSYFVMFSDLTVGFWVFLLLLSCFSPMQSVILIIVNPSFREILKKMPKCTFCTQQIKT